MRPLLRTLAVLVALLLFLASQAVLVHGQSAPATPPPVRDSQAIAAVQSAITTMGGAAAIGSIQSSVAQGTGATSAGDGTTTTNFIWSHSGQDFRYEDDATIGSHVFVSNGGSPCDIVGGTVMPSAVHVARANLPFQIPGLVLLNELSSPNYTLSYVGATTLNGRSALHIQTADNSDSVGQLVTP